MRDRRELSRRFEASAKVRIAVVGVYVLIGLLVGLALPRDLESWVGVPLWLGLIFGLSLFTTWLTTASPEGPR